MNQKEAIVDRKAPRVTIGLLVRNEGKFLKETFDSILAQDFRNFEILVGDNASTDDTSKIANEYASKYPFIHHMRHSQNIGAQENFNYLIRSSHSEFFLPAGGHDLWSKNFLSELSNALDTNPMAVLAYAPTAWIDEDGKQTGLRSGFVDTSGLKLVARFNMVMWCHQNAIYGLYRMSALQKTRLILPLVASDTVLLCELSLLGDLIVAPSATWFRRINREKENWSARMDRYSKQLFPHKKMGVLPHWRVPWAFITAVWREPSIGWQRLPLLLSAMNSFLRVSKGMVYDIRDLFSPGTWR
jgi:glycosyltransferase involved in cell wall biosynthesis